MINSLLRRHGFTAKGEIGSGSFGSVFLVSSDKYKEDFVAKLIPIRANHSLDDEMLDDSISDSNSRNVNTSKKEKSKAKCSNIYNNPGCDDNGDDDDDGNDKNKIHFSDKDNDEETNVLAHLNHPNIISFFQSFVEGGYKIIIFEYCPGGSCQDIVKNTFFHDFKKKQVLYYFAFQILSALNHCHVREIAHCDIKPANILIDKYGRPKLADFGLSQQIEKIQPCTITSYSSNNKISNSPSKNINNRNGQLNMNNYNAGNNNNGVKIAGTKAFMAPEIMSGKCKDLFLADIWSLGVTFYYIATGLSPWPPDATFSELRNSIKMGMVAYPPELDSDFANLLRDMIVVAPNHRKTAKELLENRIFQNFINSSNNNFDVNTIENDHIDSNNNKNNSNKHNSNNNNSNNNNSNNNDAITCNDCIIDNKNSKINKSNSNSNNNNINNNINNNFISNNGDNLNNRSNFGNSKNTNEPMNKPISSASSSLVLLNAKFLNAQKNLMKGRIKPINSNDSTTTVTEEKSSLTIMGACSPARSSLTAKRSVIGLRLKTSSSSSLSSALNKGKVGSMPKNLTFDFKNDGDSFQEKNNEIENIANNEIQHLS